MSSLSFRWFSRLQIRSLISLFTSLLKSSKAVSLAPEKLSVCTYGSLPDRGSVHITMCVFICWWWDCRESAEEFSNSEVLEQIPLKRHNSAAHNQLGQLAWEPVDVPSGSMNGSRRLALQFYQHLALLPQTILLVWAPSSILSPACLLLYPETMRDSFKLCVALPQHSSCHVPLHHCDLFHHLNFCHGSFHAGSCIFVFWMIRK